MKLCLDHIAIIVSTEKSINFYKNLGFIEVHREYRPNCHDELVYLINGKITLEIYKDPSHPARITNPEAYGLRHLCFTVDKIEGDFKNDNKGKYKFIYDPDGLPIELREKK